MDQEQQDRELGARLNAWQRSMERGAEGEAQEEGETERHVAATEVDHGRGVQRYPSEDENQYTLPSKREIEQRAFEEEEDMRRRANSITRLLM